MLKRNVKAVSDAIRKRLGTSDTPTDAEFDAYHKVMRYHAFHDAMVYMRENLELFPRITEDNVEDVLDSLEDNPQTYDDFTDAMGDAYYAAVDDSIENAAAFTTEEKK